MRNSTETHALDRSGLAQALRANLATLTAHSLRPDELQVEWEADPVDQVRAVTDREVAAERLNIESATVHEIEDALARLSAGEYGECEECGVRIPASRLQAVPWARLCVNCQTQSEARTG